VARPSGEGGWILRSTQGPGRRGHGSRQRWRQRSRPPSGTCHSSANGPGFVLESMACPGTRAAMPPSALMPESERARLHHAGIAGSRSAWGEGVDAPRDFSIATSPAAPAGLPGASARPGHPRVRTEPDTLRVGQSRQLSDHPSTELAFKEVARGGLRDGDGTSERLVGQDTADPGSDGE